MMTMRVMMQPSLDSIAHHSSSSSSPEMLERIDHSFRRLSVEPHDESLKKMVSEESYSATCSPMKRKSALHVMADPLDVERMRSETKKLLSLCLKAQLKTSSSSGQVEKMANTLEQHLFEMAPTLGDYSNLQTLELRLRVVLQKKMRLHNTPKSKLAQQKQQQRVILQQSLGAQRFEQIERLVSTIQEERAELVGATCAKCQYIRKLEGKTALVGAASFGSEFPMEIKQLYFGTPLVAIWERALKQPTNVSWEPLVQQAQSHLDAFYQWKAQNFVCQR